MTRSVSLIALSLSLSLATACGDKEVDSDGDGLTDEEEVELGTDPEASDSDGDGLSDSEELELGSDPNEEDSDGDGATDGEEADAGSDPLNSDSDGDGCTDDRELEAGSDPMDPESTVYQGGWPCNPDADDKNDRGWDSSAKAGKAIPRFQWQDQYGDTVDIFDFAGQGKPMLLDVSGVWCYWCHECAKWLEGEASALDDYYSDEEWYQEVPGLVESGDIYWVTVLDYGTSAPVSASDLDYWHDAYPNPAIPILMDSDAQLADWGRINGYPTVWYLDEDLKMVDGTRASYTAQIQSLYEDNFAN